MQSTAGLATGVLIYGVALGGIAALAVCVALGRIGRFGARATAALVSLGALVTVYLVPFFKYPANPPSVGDPETLGQRTTLYFLMVLLSVLLAVGAVILGRRLAPRLGNWNATVAASVAFIAVVGLAYAFLPSFNEVPKDFPAALLWRFRLAALTIQCTLWISSACSSGIWPSGCCRRGRRWTGRRPPARRDARAATRPPPADTPPPSYPAPEEIPRADSTSCPVHHARPVRDPAVGQVGEGRRRRIWSRASSRLPPRCAGLG